MFAVIEFSPEQGGGLSLVNKNWLTPRKKEVFWPPYKEQKQFNKSLKNSEDANPETWNVYNVRRIFCETDNYEEALVKLKRAEDTSDLQTEEEETLSKRRNISKPMRLLDSSDEEDNRQLPRPPKIKKALFTNYSNVKQKTIKISSPKCPLAIESTPTTSLQRPSAPNNLSEQESITLSEKSAFQIILENVLEIKNQNKLILSKLSKFETRQSQIAPEIPVDLPLKSLEYVTELETFLQEGTHAHQLITYFAGLGGDSLNSKIYRILKEVLDDSVAIFFNFFGRNKKPFHNLKICTCIVDAVKSSCGCTSAEVEKAIKIWLKHAPQRLKEKNRDYQNIGGKT